MKKIFFSVVVFAVTAGLCSCGNKITSNEVSSEDSICVLDSCAADCVVDSLDNEAARGGDETFEVDEKISVAGPGEDKPCHVSGCKCKFGYAGNWDAKKCNKCGHAMSSHY